MKTGIYILLFTGLTVMGYGQEIEYGVKGGRNYNLSEIGIGSAVGASGEVFNGERSHNGWHLGLAVRDELTKKFYIQLDGLYNRSSNVITGQDGNGDPIEQEFVYQSIQFNLNPGIKVFRILRLQGGLNANLGVDANYVETFGRFDLGYQLGVGLDLGPLTFDIGYNTSFRDHEGSWNGVPLSHNRSELLMSVGILL